MPTLPTLTVTDTQADRMIAAYGDVTTYKAWLKESIIEYVLASEARGLDEQHNATKRDQLQALRDSLA